MNGASAVSLTSDMWTSNNMDAFLAVTAHFIDPQTCLKSCLLGVMHFPQSHTSAKIASVKRSLVDEWGITSKITCLVTDGAANMVACRKALKLHHSICVAHSINLIVRKSMDMLPALTLIRTKARKLVGYFRSSTTAQVCYITINFLFIFYIYKNVCLNI